ncbi:DUF393 domain-containing protein [Aggregicoccus sp. 17bor-14]|uniref:lipase maturation factor family protein n=1 Tax=Myxococcaceae TaxID=31 RepID=UPI00129C3621|nr:MULTISPECIES: lipase maturation factor family protein [Myxococcaceae]MBF5041578.1 lipase maturation factor family protein [Simulacricoccus sp. 17bor-14]MRI87364.1 DUF393 domain-containing protein [Aggregicoccus sp. 17bor-14]
MRLHPLRRPLMVYDGDCGFCRRWVARWRTQTGARVRYAPQQLLPLWLLGIRRADARRSVQLVEPSGRVTQGARAVFRSLLYARAPAVRLAARAGLLPGVRGLAELAYRQVARHRMAASRLERRVLRGARASSHRQVRWLFLRLLGGVYLIAFTSLGRQVRGLYGARGIAPVQELLDDLEPRLGKERLTRVPSIFWLTGASDRALVNGTRAGQLLALALVANVAPRASLAALWALYLSYASTGRAFLSFQWDVLLLETSAHALLVAPGGLRPGMGEREPSALDLALMRWLVFKLYFESGLAKLQSGDRTWRDLTAMAIHHETTPLPTRLGWHAHQLPLRAQKASTAVTLALETAAPFLSFLPRPLRLAGFWSFTGLQAGIAATGNYGFFNLLSAVMGVWLLDDHALARWVPEPAPARPTRAWRHGAKALVAAPLVALSLRELGARFDRPRNPPAWLDRLAQWAAPLRSVNGYGLFSVMTLERPEIEIEGSNDGVTWRAYPMRYKPGPLNRPPRWVAPHQPRLDWQLWFAALSSPPGWFLALLGRLLEGSPEVLALFESNPFPEGPPKMVRATLYKYRMSDRATRQATGAWWKRERVGLYVAPSMLSPDEPTPPNPFTGLHWPRAQA